VVAVIDMSLCYYNIFGTMSLGIVWFERTNLISHNPPVLVTCN